MHISTLTSQNQHLRHDFEAFLKQDFQRNMGMSKYSECRNVNIRACMGIRKNALSTYLRIPLSVLQYWRSYHSDDPVTERQQLELVCGTLIEIGPTLPLKMNI